MMNVAGVVIQKPTGAPAGAPGKPANPYEVVQVPQFRKGGTNQNAGAATNQPSQISAIKNNLKIDLTKPTGAASSSNPPLAKPSTNEIAAGNQGAGVSETSKPEGINGGSGAAEQSMQNQLGDYKLPQFNP